MSEIFEGFNNNHENSNNIIIATWLATIYRKNEWMVSKEVR